MSQNDVEIENLAESQVYDIDYDYSTLSRIESKVGNLTQTLDEYKKILFNLELTNIILSIGLILLALCLLVYVIATIWRQRSKRINKKRKIADIEMPMINKEVNKENA